MADEFPAEVANELKFYVYRLIDPRNGETFYVGKGRGNRVFQHVVGAAEAEDENDDLKFQRIKEIRAAGLEVGHIIHRHGIETPDIAYQIEAALIDAYPGLSNRVTGHHSGDYGVAHADEIIRRYQAEPFVPLHDILLISIGATFGEEDRSVYSATRFAWKIDPRRAAKSDVILAHNRGLVVGVFVADKWLPATEEHFPILATGATSDRWGFVGHDAPKEIADLYLHKLVPKRFRKKGAANPIRFISKE